MKGAGLGCYVVRMLEMAEGAVKVAWRSFNETGWRAHILQNMVAFGAVVTWMVRAISVENTLHLLAGKLF